jgi:hypothetical protein
VSDGSIEQTQMSNADSAKAGIMYGLYFAISERCYGVSVILSLCHFPDTTRNVNIDCVAEICLNLPFLSAATVEPRRPVPSD